MHKLSRKEVKKSCFGTSERKGDGMGERFIITATTTFCSSKSLTALYEIERVLHIVEFEMKLFENMELNKPPKITFHYIILTFFQTFSN